MEASRVALKRRANLTCGLSLTAKLNLPVFPRVHTDPDRPLVREL
jgi:hypothetical protein